MSADARKRAAAEAALEHVSSGSVLGVGTGTTANYFIEALARERPGCSAVASSRASAELLSRHGIPLRELNDVGELELYVDGADEATRRRELIKGGGGALTREKIIAAASRLFVCIVDDSKLVERLGAFPLPLEIIPMARAHVMREMARRGGRAVWREGFVTDNGNHVLDVHGLDLGEAAALEGELEAIPGVVTSGLFVRRPADLLLVGTAGGVERI